MQLRTQPKDHLGTVFCVALLGLYAAIIFFAADVPLLQSLLIFTQLFVSTLSLWILLGLAICGIIVVREMRKGPSARPHEALFETFQKRWREEKLFWFWWPVFLYSALLTLFALFKQRVLPLAPYSYDAFSKQPTGRSSGSTHGLYRTGIPG
jgi:hypothetical protein